MEVSNYINNYLNKSSNQCAFIYTCACVCVDEPRYLRIHCLVWESRRLTPSSLWAARGGLKQLGCPWSQPQKLLCVPVCRPVGILFYVLSCRRALESTALEQTQIRLRLALPQNMAEYTEMKRVPMNCIWQAPVSKEAGLNPKYFQSCHSIAQSCPTLWDPMDCSTLGFPVLHYLQKFAQTRVHWVSDFI